MYSNPAPHKHQRPGTPTRWRAPPLHPPACSHRKQGGGKREGGAQGLRRQLQPRWSKALPRGIHPISDFEGPPCPTHHSCHLCNPRAEYRLTKTFSKRSHIFPAQSLMAHRNRHARGLGKEAHPLSGDKSARFKGLNTAHTWNLQSSQPQKLTAAGRTPRHNLTQPPAPCLVLLPDTPIHPTPQLPSSMSSSTSVLEFLSKSSQKAACLYFS